MIAFTVSAAVHFRVWAPFLGYQFIEITSSSEIETIFFHVVLSKPQQIKSLRHCEHTATQNIISTVV